MSRKSEQPSIDDIDFEYNVQITESELAYLRDRMLRFCEKCESMKPPRTHHCR